MARDLSQLAGWAESFRALMQKGPAGRAFVDAATQKQMWGFDGFAELARLAKLAQPDGKPAPAALVVVSKNRDGILELMLKVAPGFEERLAAAMASPQPPPWRGAPSSQGLAFSWGKQKASAVLGADGWLRIFAEPQGRALKHGRTDAPLSADFGRRIDDSDVALLARAGGRLEREILRGINTGVLQGLRAAAITWKTDGDRTQTTRLFIDADGIAAVRPMVRDAGLANTLVRQWDKEATAFVSLAVPRHLLQSLVPVAQVALGDGEYALPPALVQALGQTSGQLALVSFGSPGDWVLAVETTGEQAAALAVPALAAWLAKLRGAPLAPEALPPLPDSVLHWRPDPALVGMRVARLGSTVVVVGQGARLKELYSERQARPAGFLAGPLTPPVRAALSEPAILSAYAVLGSSDAFFDLATLYWSAMKVVLRKELARKLGPLEGILDRMPLILAAMGFRSMLTYDLTLSADVEGSIATVKLLASDI